MDTRKKDQNSTLATSLVATEAEIRLMEFLQQTLLQTTQDRQLRNQNKALYKSFIALAQEPGGIRNVVENLNTMLIDRSNTENHNYKKIKKYLEACEYPSVEEEKKQIGDYKKDSDEGFHQTKVMLEKTLSDYAESKDKTKIDLLSTLANLTPQNYTPTRLGNFGTNNNKIVRFIDFLNEVVLNPEKISGLFPEFSQDAFFNNVNTALNSHPKLLNGIKCLKIIKAGLDILKTLEPKPQAKASVTAETESTEIYYDEEDKAFLEEEDAYREKTEALVDERIKKENSLSDEEKRNIANNILMPKGQENSLQPFASDQNLAPTKTTQAPTETTLIENKKPSSTQNPTPQLTKPHQILDIYRQHIFKHKETLLKNPENKLEKIVKAIDGFFSWVANKDVKFFSNALENSFFKPQSNHGKTLIEHAKQSDFSLKK